MAKKAKSKKGFFEKKEQEFFDKIDRATDVDVALDKLGKFIKKKVKALKK